MNTVSEETYNYEYKLRKEAEFELFKLERNSIKIPPNATNGDIVKAVFPNGRVIDHEDGGIGFEIVIDKNYSFCSFFDGVWWNMPYRKEE
jgi:hypothetical protein